MEQQDGADKSMSGVSRFAPFIRAAVNCTFIVLFLAMTRDAVVSRRSRLALLSTRLKDVLSMCVCVCVCLRDSVNISKKLHIHLYCM